ncbi:XkdX family protein [Clostridium sp. YIM B02500]|uniref:XkdX family protein n=1 Tax=Clostridium sp. YIM B02500 TaxID=2910681 RepID=UPI001EEE3106|nr:XkdX family protein [Clostridium sp. YIM B02500]
MNYLMSIDWYTTIKNYYDKGLYTKDDVAEYVYYGKITPAQYQQITGEDYLVHLNLAYDNNKIDQIYLQACVTKGLITQSEYEVIIASKSTN